MLKAYFDLLKIEAGCDEAGRGCLAGPVVASAVILPKDFKHAFLNDSKQLRASQRSELKLEIETTALAYAIGLVTAQEIDSINILNASFLAMQRAIDTLKMKPQLLLIDGNRYKPHNEIAYKCIIKGDEKFYAIAAASVLAKTYRDQLMHDLAIEFPYYGWDTNVGYPTIKHREGLRKHGISPHHRKTFQLLPRQLALFVKWTGNF